MRKMHIFILLLLVAPLLTSRASDNPGVASLSALPLAEQSSISGTLPDCGQQLAKLTASDGLDNDRLGWYSAGISGDTVVLGAPFWPDWGTQGRAFVFVKPASGWANRARCKAKAKRRG